MTQLICVDKSTQKYLRRKFDAICQNTQTAIASGMRLFQKKKYKNLSTFASERKFDAIIRQIVTYIASKFRRKMTPFFTVRKALIFIKKIKKPVNFASKFIFDAITGHTVMSFCVDIKFDAILGL